MAGKRHEGDRACCCDQADVHCAGLTVRRLSSERVRELAEEIWTASNGAVVPARPAPDPRGSRAGVKDRGISSLSIVEIPHPVSTGWPGDYRVVVGGTSSLSRSATATGSSQDGQAPPRPTRWQNTPQSWQRCSPR